MKHMKYRQAPFKQRWKAASDKADAHVNRHGGQLFAAIAAGTVLAICSGLPGIIIRAFEAEKKGNSGGTVIINGVPMTSYVITYLLVGGLGFVAGLILYWLALDVYYYFKQ